MDRDSAKASFQRAQELFQDGESGDALHLLTELAAEFPDDKNILYAQARCFEGLGRSEEAAALCRRIIERWESPRVEKFLAKIETPSKDAEAVSDELFEFKTGAMTDFPVPEPDRRHRRGFVILAVGAVLVLVTWLITLQYMNAAPKGLNPYSKSELQRARVRGKRAEPEAPTGPGRHISEQEWMRTAVNGLPVWEPGIYRNVNSGVTFRTPDGIVHDRSIDVYIPMAYRERSEELFPSLAISMPKMYGGFLKLNNWAEQNDVILIVINTSSNKYYNYNKYAQDAALMVLLTSGMRVDQRMGFALGMSGGAATSWEMICRYPNNFAGLVMMGMSEGHNDCWIPSHVRVAYIHGASDHNNQHIRRVIPRLRRTGNLVREVVVPGGHVMGPVQEREKMLSWMLRDVRRELGTMTNVGVVQ